MIVHDYKITTNCSCGYLTMDTKVSAKPTPPTSLSNVSPNPANCSSPKRAKLLTNKENAKRYTAFSADRNKVLALPQQRRALRRVLLNKGVCQKPVLAPLPGFSRTARTTFAESNSHPAPLRKGAREEAVNVVDNWLIPDTWEYWLSQNHPAARSSPFL